MAQTDTFTSSGTWVCPPSVTVVSVECWGAGGGGGGGSFRAFHYSLGGNGGGGGAYSKLNTFSVTPGNSYTVTVGQGGAGGIGGSPSGATSGSDGGDSWFNSTGTVLAKGGTGGIGDSNNFTPTISGTGGQSSGGVGDVKHSGGDAGGLSGPATFENGGGGGGGAGSTGDGGSSVSQNQGTGTTIGGGNGGIGSTTQVTTGADGSPLGGGGGGASGLNGGKGGNGQVNITYTATTDQISSSDSSAVSDKSRIILPGTHGAPIITFRDPDSPWSVIPLITYKETSPSGNDLPVLDNDDSNKVLFRIYNNFLLAPNTADAMNPTLTTFDGVGVHTASMPVASQRWTHVLEYGFGQGGSAPGLYTVAPDVDSTVGGTTYQYTIPYGSDGQTPAAIRAGVTGSGCGFIEIDSYIQVPAVGSQGLQTFALSVSFDWVT